MADTIAPLANLIGGEFGVQGALSQDASGNWLLSNTSNEGTTTSSLLQNDLTSDQWAQFQQLLSKGYLDTSTMQGRALLSNNAPSIGGLAPSQQFGLANMGSGYVSLGNNENTGPPSMYGGRQLTDPSMVKWDPNYGWITPQANVKSDDDWIDKVGSFVGDIAPGAIMAALSAGFGALGNDAYEPCKQPWRVWGSTSDSWVRRWQPEQPGVPDHDGRDGSECWESSGYRGSGWDGAVCAAAPSAQSGVRSQ